MMKKKNVCNNFEEGVRKTLASLPNKQSSKVEHEPAYIFEGVVNNWAFTDYNRTNPYYELQADLEEERTKLVLRPLIKYISLNWFTRYPMTSRPSLILYCGQKWPLKHYNV